MKTALEEIREALTVSLGRRPELGHAAYELWVSAYLACQVSGASMTPWSFVGSCTQAAWAAIEKQMAEADERGRMAERADAMADVEACSAGSMNSTASAAYGVIFTRLKKGFHVGVAARAKKKA